MLSGPGALNRVGAAVASSLSPASAALNLDFTLGTLDDRITFTRASTATYFDKDGVLQSAASGEARFDYDPSTLAPRGLLIEEQRVNSIRNNTMQGAVAGTPGTLPTNWSGSSTADGVTREIVSIGTENGISYIDIRFSGTPTAGTNSTINFDAANSIAASSGQTWTESVYLKLQAGSFSGTSTTLSLLGTNGSSGTEAITSAGITSTPSNLAAARLSVAGTFANAGTTHAQPRVRIGYTVGTPFDITLRIGLPQLEQGATATSVIPTTTTALTRNADVTSMTGTNFSGWYNASEGTLYGDWSRFGTGTLNYVVGLTSDTTTSSAVQLALQNRNAVNQIRVWQSTVGGGLDDSITLTSATAEGKAATAYGNGTNVSGSANGAAIVTMANPITDTLFNAMTLGHISGATGFMNGHIRRIAYYPTRLSNAQLQALTA